MLLFCLLLCVSSCLLRSPADASMPLARFGSVWFLCSLCCTPCLRSMLLVLPSPIPLFGFVSYYLLMILRSSTDRGPSKALRRFVLQVCLGLGSRRLNTRAAVVSVAPTRVNSTTPQGLTYPTRVAAVSLTCLSCPHHGSLVTTLVHNTSLPQRQLI